MHAIDEVEGRRHASSADLLGRDERGAMLLLGLLMAVFLVAVIYYLVGIGEAVSQREGMQDTADAAVFSAAILHARSMNFIVLVNLVMMALVAILLIFNVVITLIRIAIVALTLASFFTLGASGGLATALAELKQTLQESYDAIEPVVMTSLEELHRVSSVVRRVVPEAAQLVAIEEARRHHQDPAKLAFVVPSRSTLPVEPDAYAVLCSRAAKSVSGFVTEPLPSAARKLVMSAAEDVTRATSQWLCGAGGAPPPKYTQKSKRWYPSLDEQQECLDQATNVQPDAHDDDRCEALRQAERAAAPDAFGDCPTTSDCSRNGDYERLMAQARKQCNPARNHRLEGFSWQQKTVSEKLTWNGERWVSDEKIFGQGRMLPPSPATVDAPSGEDEPPCGTANATIDAGWNETPYADDGEPLPICSEDYSKQLPPDPSPGETATVRYEAVTRLLACNEAVEVSVPIGASDAKPIGGDGKGKEPYRIAGELTLGSEDFQVRSMAVGAEPKSLSARVMALATWGRCANAECSGTFDTARELSKFSMAQAEYYFDHSGSEPRAEWMWSMKWRARLVRLRSPRKSENSEHDAADETTTLAKNPSSACRLAASSEDCARVAQLWDNLSSLILH